MSPARLAALGLCVIFAAPAAAAPPSAADEFFEKEVRPLLVERCLKCHGGEKTRGGLKLTSREAILKGGDTGPAAAPGKPKDSLLVQALHYTETVKMPKDGKLDDKEVAVLTRWVEVGLPYPSADAAQVKGPGFQITDEQRKFWAFQPVKVVPPDDVKDKSWAKSDLDRYILSALEAKGLKPAKSADRRTLIRRATFDLTGLPPTPEEIDAFLKDDSPGAFATVVDRLLSSPAYGERWGRHWLDLARYTDSFDARGVGGEGDCADAWRYRDWVIDAFNKDMPYDEFVRDQVAGDLAPTKDGFNRSGTIATGFLAIGNWGGGDADKDKLLTDIADDQVDAVSRTFLGLTTACARCHDHKFDPISQADYYGLAGMFFSTHILPNVGPKTDGPPMLRIPLLPPDELAKRQDVQKGIEEGDKNLKQARAKAYEDFAQARLPETAKYLTAVWEFKQQSPATSMDDFASKKGLHPSAFRHWIDYLSGGDVKLMTKAVRDVGGKAGVHGWRGEADCPNVLANSTNAEVSILTFKLPPKSVSVHPGPKNGVAVRWRSPIKGTFRVSGGVTDADPACGDGIAWAIDLRHEKVRQDLAAGEFPNGGSQKFDQGKGADALKAIEMEEGDALDLVVLPKGDYSCDTTTVDLTIALADDSKKWNLAADAAGDILADGKGNPHADGYGNASVWSFLDMAESRRAQNPGGDAALEALEKATAGDDRAAVEKAAAEFQKAFAFTDARSPFFLRSADDEKALADDLRHDLAKRAADLDALKKTPLPPLEYANGAQDGGVPGSPHEGVHDVRIHGRGRYDRLGDLVPRRFPEILAGTDQKPVASGSGRLQLAEWLSGKDNPLTARVMVNRIWQHHFGEGIVATPSNFGKLGARPSHPELLDYLADEFERSGWSIKAMHRRMMLSATYQQSCDNEKSNADPENRLLNRMNRRRLEAEAVRDGLLAVAGRLDMKMGGLGVRDFNAPRRTVYLMTIRSDRSGFGPLFDVADSTAPVDKRTVSTVAPQALFLMNHPFILEQRKALAKRVVAEGKDERERIERAYALLYGRPPVEVEVKIGLDFLAKGGGEKAWEEYCQVLLCANEFIYVD
jgi:cytochrome c553